MTTVLRIIAWLLAAAAAFATLGPPEFRPQSHLGRHEEHALAFALIGLAFGLAYARHRLLISVIAVVVTGTIEILQMWTPGRHARLGDFVIDAVAACAGIAIAAALDWTMRRLNWKTKAS